MISYFRISWFSGEIKQEYMINDQIEALIKAIEEKKEQLAALIIWDRQRETVGIIKTNCMLDMYSRKTLWLGKSKSRLKIILPEVTYWSWSMYELESNGSNKLPFWGIDFLRDGRKRDEAIYSQHFPRRKKVLDVCRRRVGWKFRDLKTKLGWLRKKTVRGIAIGKILGFSQRVCWMVILVAIIM